MVKVGKTYAPTGAKIVQGGKYTQFTIPQSHWEGSRYVTDGFLNILTPGEYTFQKGDRIKVKKITAVTIRLYGRTHYFSVYANVDYTPWETVLMMENKGLLEEIDEWDEQV